MNFEVEILRFLFKNNFKDEINSYPGLSYAEYKYKFFIYLHLYLTKLT